MGTYPPSAVHPSRAPWPVLLSIPHAGRDYDRATLDNAAQGLRSLEPLEDPLVDRLAWRAIATGVGAVVQQVPRAVIDCNRGEEEVDPAAIAQIAPAPVGMRARHGLGLVPSRTQRHGALWRRPISREDLFHRLEAVHRPYHEALAVMLDRLATEHGQALLIDCHSMPARPASAVDLVIGDRHRTSAAPWVSAEAARIARANGFRVSLNDPYAGGAIIARHGRPAEGLHALQLEFDRSTYLAADSRRPGPGFDRVARLIETLARELGEALRNRCLREAAE